MLLTGYTKKIFRPECNPRFQSIHCIARLNEDVANVLPYLNTVLGGTQFLNDPPEVMFHHQGKIIKVGAKEIAINALKDEQEADRILKWLTHEINSAWKNRANIEPDFKGRDRPSLMEILKLLPRTNCKRCNQPTCMVFASQLVDGARDVSDCPELDDLNKEKLFRYLTGFTFE